jgi:cell division protein FtsI (penicillin-binding protein 3)
VFDKISVSDVIAFSSNIGAVKIAQYLDTERVRETVERFGLTQKTGVRLPAEAFSSPKEDPLWRPILLANVAFGQGISMTPLQLAFAYAPLANGGLRVRPKVLLGESDSNRSASYEGTRVLSPNTVDRIRKILVSATEKQGATGVMASVSGIHVAGKTGTAQKYVPGVGYGSGKYVASFVGFLPAESAELLIAVIVDEPRWPYYASQTAAPVFKKIAERSLQILGRASKTLMTKQIINAPPTVFAPSHEQPELSGSVSGKMPDLQGRSVREVMRILGPYFNDIQIAGAGYLSTQTPAAGIEVSSQTPVRLQFSHNGG